MSVVSACAALVTVATPRRRARTLRRPIGRDHRDRSGLGVAARILANQLRSTQAPRRARRALAEKERALAETDPALERVREANETLRESEEHLRLVFDAAVDGIVELDERDVILRANEAFCRMVQPRPGVDRGAAVVGARRVDDGRRRLVRLAPHDRPGHDPAGRRAAALPGVAHLRRPDDAAAPTPARPRRHGRAGWPTRRSGRCSSSCRTATRTARACSVGRTPRSRPSATGSPATSTTARSRACRPRRSRSRRRC